MPLAIKSENISKAYQLGEISTGTVSRDLERWVSRIQGKEDPFLKVGEENDRTKKGTSNIVWSLKDINFEIEQGDAVGIIGRNGAGKSTLLKILSRVTSPTTGKIIGKGRIASLLEVGTGFHPELTGRENIYLNGAILGMRKREITRKFEEIVDFAGIERYIDTPVKRYSSGMYVRLAFAVAAYLESEILIVDEVLAVGDAEFQKKCLGKMSEVNKSESRTILFVSHNMAAVTSLCKSGIVLESGKISYSGSAHEAVNYYKNIFSNGISYKYTVKKKAENYISKVFFSDNEQNLLSNITADTSCVYLNFELEVSNPYNINLGFTFYDFENNPLISSSLLDTFENISKGINQYKIQIPFELFKSGDYYIQAALWNSIQVFDENDAFIKINVQSRSKLEINGQGIKGLLVNPYKWKFNIV